MTYRLSERIDQDMPKLEAFYREQVKEQAELTQAIDDARSGKLSLETNALMPWRNKRVALEMSRRVTEAIEIAVDVMLGPGTAKEWQATAREDMNQ